MAIDKFGNEVPVSPGYKRIIGSDGVPVKAEETIFLGAGVTASAVVGGTLIDVAAATVSTAGSMSAADKVKLNSEWVKIEGTITKTAQAVGNYATATWAAGTYRQVRLVLRQITVTGGSNIDEIRMAGLTGTYNSTFMYWQSVAPGFVSSASKLLAFSSAVVRGEFIFDLPDAPSMKGYTGKANVTSQSTAQGYEYVGKNDDTTHEVTGLVLVIATDVVTFSYELYGLPA